MSFPYKVHYRRPGEEGAVLTRPDYASAEVEAGILALAGSSVTVTVLAKGEPVFLSTFGPDVVHVPTAVGDDRYVCGCSGIRSCTREEILDHLRRAGKCYFCWDLAVYDLLDGQEVDCPSCEGTGSNSDSAHVDSTEAGQWARAYDYIRPDPSQPAAEWVLVKAGA